MPPEHLAAGRCEAAKICYARDQQTFDRYLAVAGGRDFSSVVSMVSLSLGAKKWFVETDEFDQNERLLLNFGHSFGHALESCSAYQVTHGVAVGVGCLSAVNFSAAAQPELKSLPKVAALRAYLKAVLGSVDGLSEALAKVEHAQFFHYWQSDKKHTPDQYRPILLDDEGTLYRAAIPRDTETNAQIWDAFDQARRELA